MKKTSVTDNTLSEDHILSIAQEFITNKKRGIYFLICNGEIVYVGQSVDIESRIQQHSGKKFDSYSYVIVDKHIDLNEIEAKYIIKFQPLLNKTLPHTFGCISEAYLNKTRSGGSVRNADKLREAGITPEFSIHRTRYFNASVLDMFDLRPYYQRKIDCGEEVL